MSWQSMRPTVPGLGCRRIAIALVTFLFTWFHPASALAHGSLAIGDFYTGMLHPLLHLETLLPIFALALWSGQLGGPHSLRLPLIFLAAALLGASVGILEVELQFERPLLRLSMLVLGLLVATQGKPPALAAVAMALLFGIYHGHASTYDPGGQIARPLLFVAGLGSCIGLILFHIVTRVLRYQAFWVKTGVRVLGSWIAATGLLVLALEWAVTQ